MTILVPEVELTQEFTVNIPNMTEGGIVFELTSQYSHQPLELSVDYVINSNDRYSTLEVTFPAGFGDAHKSGIYNWRLIQNLITLEAGLVKIVTNPGGSLGIKEFISNPETEERVSEVYYRPNY